MQIIIKQPDESRNYGIDFVNLITSGDSITTITTVTASPDGLTVGSASLDGFVAEFKLTGGTAGTVYHIEALVQTYLGEIVEGDGYLQVIDATEYIPQTPSLISSWGGGTSNSYTSLTNANSWITNNVFEQSAWLAASDTQKSLSLAEATRQIDSRQYIYDRKYTTQSLEFPRGVTAQWELSGAYAVETLSELEERMQLDVERACCLQAVHLIKQQTYKEHEDMVSAGIKATQKTVGPITERYEYGNPYTNSAGSTQGTRINPLCESSLEYLRNWMTTRKIYRG